MLYKANRPVALSVLLGLPLFISPAASAQDLILQPFVAHYSSTWDVGLKIAGKATRQLQQLENGQWQLSLNAKALVAKLSETSVMAIDEGQIAPIDYHYHRKILQNNKQLRIEFDWAKNQATTTTSKSWNMPIQLPLQDKLSVQLQLRKDISQQASGRITYQVAAGGQIERFRYQVHQQEPLSLESGHYEAIKVERLREDDSQRQTFIWFAPELNFHVVRIVQIEPGGKRYQLDLNHIEQ
ncbi:MAG TPA: hypothetical protein DE179_07030 [Oceanospirillaceae bacterium]|nr:hypothetical protein [Oceanospirillaceae bacterium]